MESESLRTRLEALNRGPLPAAASVKPRRRPPRQSMKREPTGQIVSPIPGLLRQGKVVSTGSGEHLRLKFDLEQLWPRGEQLVLSRREYLADSLANDAEQTDLGNLIQRFPDSTLFVDLETCGLAGSALFLIGLLRNIDSRQSVELLLARNYAEEPAVLETFWQIVGENEVLVTYNGKSFDWPMLLDRSSRHLLFRKSKPPELLHVDLLHHCRRKWRGQFADCRLQTLEHHVCRRKRQGDIPGHLIPAAYADYVRTGFERDMEAILYHNAVDLVTLLDLAMRVAG